MRDQQPRDPKSQGAKRLRHDAAQVPDPTASSQGSAAAEQPGEPTGARRLNLKAFRLAKKRNWCSTSLYGPTYFNEAGTTRWRGCSSSPLFNAGVATDEGLIHLYPPGPEDDTVTVTYGDKSTTCTMPLGDPLAAVGFVMEPDVVYYLPVTGPERILVEGTEVIGITIHTKGWTSRARTHRPPMDEEAKAAAAKAKAAKKQKATETQAKATETKEPGTTNDGTESPT